MPGNPQRLLGLARSPRGCAVQRSRGPLPHPVDVCRNTAFLPLRKWQRSSPLLMPTILGWVAPAILTLAGTGLRRAEYERNLISERTIAGCQAAKRRGTRLGRPKALSPRALDVVLLMTQKGVHVRKLRTRCSTVDRARRMLHNQGKLR